MLKEWAGRKDGAYNTCVNLIRNMKKNNLTGQEIAHLRKYAGIHILFAFTNMKKMASIQTIPARVQLMAGSHPASGGQWDYSAFYLSTARFT